MSFGARRDDDARAALPAAIARELESVDAAFARAQAEDGDRIPCRRGCGACCAAVFDVHPADAVLLGTWLDAQPAADREALLDRARAVVGRVEAAAHDLAAREGETVLAGWRARDGLQALPSAIVTRLAGEVAAACPLLDDEGACRAHAQRPALCRLQGLPWRDPATGATLPDFCRLVPAQAGLAPRSLDLASLDGARLEAALEARRLGLPVPRGRTIVAQALVRWAEGRPSP